MEAYDRCTNLGKKNLSDSIAVYGRGRELLRPLTYKTVPPEQKVSWTFIQSRTEILENGLLNLLRRMLYSLFRIQIAAVKLCHTVYRIHEQQ